MNAAASEALAASADERRTLEGLVQRAVRRSFPLFTYKEFKRLVRCEYHRFVMQLREQRTWDELTALTGMTRAGLNKLGDTVPPTTRANAMRTLLAILQRAGEDGVSLGEVASSFYAEFPFLDDAPELRQALGALLTEGFAELGEDGRYRACASEMRYSPARTNSIVQSVIEVAQRIQEAPGPERMLRFTFHVPDSVEGVEYAQDEMKRTLLAVAERLEDEAHAQGQPTRIMTVVYAGGPDAP